MGGNYEKILYRDYEELCLKYNKVSDEYKRAIDENKYLKHIEDINKKKIESKDLEILNLKNENNSLKEEIDKLRAKLNRDGTNSSIPTSQTPVNKKKVIPNSRKKKRQEKRSTART